MKRALVLAGMVLCFAPSSFPETLVFIDGAEMEVEKYEIKGRLLVFTTMEGRARSVPISLIDIQATEEINRPARTLQPAEPPPPQPGDNLPRAPVAIEIAAGGRADRAREVLVACGVKSLASRIPSLVSEEVAAATQPSSGKGARTSEIVRDAFARAFRSESLYAAVVNAFAEHAQDPELTQALAWLRSFLARRMVGMEQSARSKESRGLLREFATGLERHMPPATRLEMLQQLDELTGGTEAEIERRIRVHRGAIEALNLLAPEEERLSEGQIDQVLQETRSKLQAPLRNQSLVNLLFTYRSADDQELADYVAYWKSESGQWLTRTTRESLSAGIIHGLDTAIETVAIETQQVTRRRER